MKSVAVLIFFAIMLCALIVVIRIYKRQVSEKTAMEKDAINKGLLAYFITDRMASTHINSRSAAIASFNLSVYFITLDYLFSPFNGFYPFSFPLKHRFHNFIVSVCSSDHFSDKRASLISDYLL